MKLIVIVIISIFTISSCAQNPGTPEDWLEQNLVVLDKNGEYDFSDLGKAIGDKRIVALGESSHGLGAFYALKSELVKYLYEEKGFEVIAMEGGLGDINLAYSDVDTLSADQLRDNTVFGNFRAAEVTPMFQLIKESSRTTRPLIYTGYDTQASSAYVQKTLSTILKPYNKELSDSLQTRLWSYGKSYQAGNNGDSTGYIKHRDIFRNTSKEAASVLEQNSVGIKETFDLSDFDFKILQRTLLMFQKSTNLSYQNRYEGNGLRDKLMFENLQWIMTELYPNKKTIIWAHNAHIENSNVKGSTIPWMGHFLKDNYKKDYYSVGLFAYKGETYQHWTREVIPFENSDSTYIENKLVDSESQMTFIDLESLEENKNNQWLFQPTDAFEVENGGQVSFIPKSRFDGIITVYESGAPTFMPPE